MISNYLVRCTVVGHVAGQQMPEPVVGYCRFEGYPAIKFTNSLRDASFFGDGGTFDAADQANAKKHMHLLPDHDVVKRYFKAWLNSVVDPSARASYTLELVQFKGESLEQLEITIVDTLEGVKEAVCPV